MVESTASDVSSVVVSRTTLGAAATGRPECGKILIETLVRSVAIVGALFYVIRLPRPHHRAVVQVARGLVDGVVMGEVLVLPEVDESP